MIGDKKFRIAISYSWL